MTTAVTQRGAPATGLVMQIAQRCRAEPVIFDDFCAELCPQLAEIILHRMKHDRRSTASINRGGWKSTEDFFTWSDDPVQELRRAIVAELGAPRPIAWAMVNRAGSQHPRHQHRIAILSGVYYVTSGSEDAITPTIFECPSDARAARGPDRYDLEVEPHPGRIVICRGETWHRVPIYSGQEPRITIAFDVRR